MGRVYLFQTLFVKIGWLSRQEGMQRPVKRYPLTSGVHMAGVIVIDNQASIAYNDPVPDRRINRYL